MRAKVLVTPRGGYSLKAGSVVLLGIFFYVFLGAAPVAGMSHLYVSVGLDGFISLDAFFALGHMAIYGLLTLGLCAIFETVDKRPAIAATLMGVGVAIEVLQEEFFGRQFQLGDVIANMTGIAAGMIIMAIITRRGRQQTDGS